MWLFCGEFYNNVNAAAELTEAVNKAIISGNFNDEEQLPAVNTTAVAIAKPEGKIFYNWKYECTIYAF